MLTINLMTFLKTHDSIESLFGLIKNFFCFEEKLCINMLYIHVSNSIVIFDNCLQKLIFVYLYIFFFILDGIAFACTKRVKCTLSGCDSCMTPSVL